MKYVLDALGAWGARFLLLALASCDANGSPSVAAPSDASLLGPTRDATAESSIAEGGTAEGLPAPIDATLPRDAASRDAMPNLTDAMPDATGISDGGLPESAVRADAGPPVATVQCGASACDVDEGGAYLVCCTNDLGVTGTCRALGACTLPFYCGGPENCISTASCCAFGGGTSCLPIGLCASAANGTVVCHTVDDCAAGEACCPLAAGSSFRTCQATACP